MSNAFFEGDFVGRPVKVEFGTNPKNGRPTARITMEITEGDKRGRQVPYEANFKQEAIGYTKRDLMAAGWQGKTMATFVDDVTKAGQSEKPIPFSVRIATFENPETGKVRQWLSVGSIGNYVPPIVAATKDDVRDVDQWFAEVPDAPPAPPAPQQQQPAQQSGRAQGWHGDHPNAPHPNAPGNRNNIPF